MASSLRALPYLLLAFAPAVTFAQPGMLDDTFGDGGIVLTPIGTANAVCYKVLAAPEGGYYAAGSCSSDANGTDFALVKYNANGAPDNGFGTSGLVTKAVGTSNDNCYTAALQSDGKILLGGDYNAGGNAYNFAVVRFNTDGTPDAGFGTNGVATLDMGGTDNYGTDMAVQPDGKILLMGRHMGTDFDYVVVRFNADGTPDTGFGTNGIHIQPIGANDDAGYAMALQPDGKIILVGDIKDADLHWDVALVRLNADGTPDNSFGTNGIAVHSLSANDDYGTACVLQPDGKIVVAGGGYAGDLDYMLARFGTNGDLDPGFGTNGVTFADFGGVESSSAVARGADGGFVVTGSNFTVGFDVMHFSADGQLDLGFGTNGHTTTAIGTAIFNSNTSVLIDGQQHIVAAGHARDPSTANEDFALIRYQAAGPAGIVEATRSDLHATLAPDPVAASTTLGFALDQEAFVSLAVVDAAGRCVARPWMARTWSAGMHSELLDLSALGAGHYTLVLSIGTQRTSLPFVKAD